MKDKNNRRKASFLESIPTASFHSDSDLIAGKCKFNFSYMDVSQIAGQNFSDWTNDQLCRLLDKLRNYSREPLNYWKNERIGSGRNTILEIYGQFPRSSDFTHPKHVPIEARWARFRLEADMRLIGFLVTNELHDHVCKHTRTRFDTNTFYIVFLDEHHRFYRTT